MMIVIYSLICITAAGLAAYCIEAHLAKNRKIQPFNILLPCLLAALLYLRYVQTPLMTIKGDIFPLTLFYAAMQDIRTREVDDSVSIVIAMNALIQFDPSRWIYMLFGGIVTVFPLFLAALIKPGRIGGADVKIMAAVGFLLGAEKGILALMIGLLLAVICVPIYRKIKKTKTNAVFALVPFLAAGIYAAFLL